MTTEKVVRALRVGLLESSRMTLVTLMPLAPDTHHQRQISIACTADRKSPRCVCTMRAVYYGGETNCGQTRRGGWENRQSSAHRWFSLGSFPQGSVDRRTPVVPSCGRSWSQERKNCLPEALPPSPKRQQCHSTLTLGQRQLSVQKPSRQRRLGQTQSQQ